MLSKSIGGLVITYQIFQRFLPLKFCAMWYTVLGGAMVTVPSVVMLYGTHCTEGGVTAA